MSASPVHRVPAPSLPAEAEPVTLVLPAPERLSCHCHRKGCPKPRGAAAAPPPAETEPITPLLSAPENPSCRHCRGWRMQRGAAAAPPPVQRVLVPSPLPETEPTASRPLPRAETAQAVNDLFQWSCERMEASQRHLTSSRPETKTAHPPAWSSTTSTREMYIPSTFTPSGCP